MLVLCRGVVDWGAWWKDDGGVEVAFGDGERCPKRRGGGAPAVTLEIFMAATNGQVQWEVR